MRYKEQAINTFKKIDTSNWNSFKDNVFIRLINKKIADTQPEYENAIKVPFMDLYKMFYIREIDRGNDIVYGYTLPTMTFTEPEDGSLHQKRQSRNGGNP